MNSVRARGLSLPCGCTFAADGGICGASVAAGMEGEEALMLNDATAESNWAAVTAWVDDILSNVADACSLIGSDVVIVIKDVGEETNEGSGIVDSIVEDAAREDVWASADVEVLLDEITT